MYLIINPSPQKYSSFVCMYSLDNNKKEDFFSLNI